MTHNINDLRRLRGGPEVGVPSRLQHQVAWDSASVKHSHDKRGAHAPDVRATGPPRHVLGMPRSGPPPSRPGAPRPHLTLTLAAQSSESRESPLRTTSGDAPALPPQPDRIADARRDPIRSGRSRSILRPRASGARQDPIRGQYEKSGPTARYCRYPNPKSVQTMGATS